LSYPCGGCGGPSVTTRFQVCAACKRGGVTPKLPEPTLIPAVPQVIGEVDGVELLQEMARIISRQQQSITVAQDEGKIDVKEMAKMIDSLSRGAAAVGKELRQYETLRHEQAKGLDFDGAADVILQWFKERPPEQQRRFASRIAELVAH
jgi:hypothetical protein